MTPLKAMTEREEELQEALYRIEQWCKAYPVEVFPPLSEETIVDAGAILEAHDISMGALHAGWARHILGDIAKIIASTRREL